SDADSAGQSSPLERPQDWSATGVVAGASACWEGPHGRGARCKGTRTDGSAGAEPDALQTNAARPDAHTVGGNRELPAVAAERRPGSFHPGLGAGPSRRC